VESKQVTENSWVVFGECGLAIYVFAQTEHVHDRREPRHVPHPLMAGVVQLHHGKLEPLTVRVNGLHRHRFRQHSGWILTKMKISLALILAVTKAT
jgi:hypothetical protein